MMLGRIPMIGPLLRTWRGRFIVAFVGVQLLLPLAYYVARKDPHDERFAWRMFSPMRMAKCEPRVTVADRPLVLEAEFHEAWVNIARRGRFSVLEAMGARLCTEHPGAEVRITLDCTYLDREARTYGGYNMCSVPEL